MQDEEIDRESEPQVHTKPRRGWTKIEGDVVDRVVVGGRELTVTTIRRRGRLVVTLYVSWTWPNGERGTRYVASGYGRSMWDLARAIRDAAAIAFEENPPNGSPELGEPVVAAAPRTVRARPSEPTRRPGQPREMFAKMAKIVARTGAA